MLLDHCYTLKLNHSEFVLEKCEQEYHIPVVVAIPTNMSAFGGWSPWKGIPLDATAGCSDSDNKWQCYDNYEEHITNT